MDQVVAAVADQPGQPSDGRQVPVAAHPEVDDPDAVGPQPVRHRTRVGERDHVALHRQMTQQQPQLLLGAAYPEPGDDVQRPHRGPPARAGDAAREPAPGTAPWRSPCRRSFAQSRTPRSAWLTWVRGSANRLISGPGASAQPYP
ncbi:hypothetical protein SMICM304S_10452 [Streptomyces microflavus]